MIRNLRKKLSAKSTNSVSAEPRIICDTYFKKDKPLWMVDNIPPESVQAFNRIITAVNQMYAWLYRQNILDTIAFAFRDYPERTYFAFDAADLLPFRTQMESSGVIDADLACHCIFDHELTPCRYSGAIQFGWTMQTYRDNGGCVSSSWELSLVQNLSIKEADELSRLREAEGIEAAIRSLFESEEWSKAYLRGFTRNGYHLHSFTPKLSLALIHYGLELAKDDRLPEYADELIFCFENEKELVDFDFWTQYISLLRKELGVGRDLTYDEYMMIGSMVDAYPHELEGNRKTLEKLWAAVHDRRESEVNKC